MGLLNPLLLLLGAAAAVPLLLHLLQRHQGPRVVFPAVRYLRRAEKESARRIRLRQILLMLLRVAAVLLIALAAARPFLRSGGAGHAPTAVVIVLDNSMSSGAVDDGSRVLDALKQRALEVLEDATPEDRFWLLRAGERGEPALAGDAAMTALRVRETEPSIAAADLGTSLRHAAAVLAAGAGARAPEIHLLTDLQAGSFPADAPGDPDAPPVMLWHPGSEPPPNRTVVDVTTGAGFVPTADRRTTLAAAIGGSDDAEVGVRLAIDGRLVGAGRGRAGTSIVLPLPPQPAGHLAGHVEIDADALRADDRRHFALRILPPPAVAVRGQLPFVDDAVAILADADRVRPARGTAADVVIGTGGTGLEGADALIVLPPTSPGELPAANRALARAGIPWRFGPVTAGEARFAGILTDPLLTVLQDARLRQVHPLLPDGAGAGDSVLLRLSDGSPWAVRGDRRTGGRYVVLASPLTADASTIPTSAAMLPLLDRMVGVWALGHDPRTDAAPGAEVALPDGATIVERPDGVQDEVAGETAYRPGSGPGVYRVLGGDSVLAAFAVNPSAAESDLRRLDPRELEARLPGWTLRATSSRSGWRRATFRERLGRELWRPLLLLLLAVLAVETIIATAGRSRRAGAPDPAAGAAAH